MVGCTEWSNIEINFWCTSISLTWKSGFHLIVEEVYGTFRLLMEIVRCGQFQSSHTMWFAGDVSHARLLAFITCSS